MDTNIHNYEIRLLVGGTSVNVKVGSTDPGHVQQSEDQLECQKDNTTQCRHVLTEQCCGADEPGRKPSRATLRILPDSRAIMAAENQSAMVKIQIARFTRPLRNWTTDTSKAAERARQSNTLDASECSPRAAQFGRGDGVRAESTTKSLFSPSAPPCLLAWIVEANPSLSLWQEKSTPVTARGSDGRLPGPPGVDIDLLT